MWQQGQSFWQQAWLGTPAQWLYAGVLAGAVACMFGWAGWCLWVERAERRMLAEVLAMMGQASDAGGPPG